MVLKELDLNYLPFFELNSLKGVFFEWVFSLFMLASQNKRFVNIFWRVRLFE